MDRFEQLKIIVDGMIKDQKKEIENDKGVHSEAHGYDLMRELQGFQRIYAKMLAIRDNGPSVADEMIEKV